MIPKAIFVLAVFSLLTFCSKAQRLPLNVQTGLDRIFQYQALFANKRVGIVTNHTAYDSRGRHISDVFSEMSDVTISALFGPEHGIRGAAEAGAKVGSRFDPIKGVPVYSLYGATKKPTPDMLKNVDILVFDIQDIGARFYTYIYTMALAMEAAAEQGIPFVVLDRPNPINGTAVEGNILDTAYASFVGLYPLPVRHGMTVGELAQMFNGEGWLRNGVQADLTVIPMGNWHRRMWFDETGLVFIKTSPNMPDLETATVYPGLCLLEGTNVSTGRGTSSPFKLFGAPWIDSPALVGMLNELKLPGVVFREAQFTPQAIKGVAEHPRYENRLCRGARVVVTQRDDFQPYRTGLHVVEVLHRLYPDSFRFVPSHFDRLTGTDTIRKAILAGADLEELMRSWEADLQAFQSLREKYLIYE